MNWSRTIFKTGTLATVGFLIPYAMLLPVEYAHSEFRTQPADWNTLLLPYLPPATGCSLLFMASAITSSTPRKTVTFIQSLFLHGVTFIVCVLAFVPIQHSKIGDPQAERLAWIPFVAELLVFVLLIIIGNLPPAGFKQNAKTVAHTHPDKYDA